MNNEIEITNFKVSFQGEEINARCEDNDETGDTYFFFQLKDGSWTKDEYAISGAFGDARNETANIHKLVRAKEAQTIQF